ncbi:MAG: sulfur carrier protein ThiS [Gammaproteobacteria bacterium]|nr:sulfur carrier protein ThiS [Gammaproteobacteria bacterium]
MEITLNGSLKQVPDGTTATRLIEILQLTGKRLAIEINEEIVPRSTYGEHKLNSGDQVEIVHAIGGG